MGIVDRVRKKRKGEWRMKKVEKKLRNKTKVGGAERAVKVGVETGRWIHL